MQNTYDELNENHCRRVDKFYRQFAGLSSEIISYENKTIELEIRISRRWPKDPKTTAKQISNDWRIYHDLLKEAMFYKIKLVFLNSGQETGGSFSPDREKPAMIQEIIDILDTMNKKGENKSIIITGPIDDENDDRKNREMEIEFMDSKELRIRFYSVIINVSKINETFGRVYDFCKRFKITGITNGELLILYYMSYPDDDLVLDVLNPIGLTYGRDYVVAKEALIYGVENKPSSSLNKPLSEFENVSWIGSILRKDGNWVWKK